MLRFLHAALRATTLPPFIDVQPYNPNSACVLRGEARMLVARIPQWISHRATPVVLLRPFMLAKVWAYSQIYTDGCDGAPWALWLLVREAALLGWQPKTIGNVFLSANRARHAPFLVAVRRLGALLRRCTIDDVLAVDPSRLHQRDPATVARTAGDLL